MDERRRSAASHRVVQLLLRGGLALGSLLMVVGLLMALIEGRLQSHEVRASEVVHLVATGQPSGVAALGLVVLLATPIARVLAMVVLYARERDLRFAAVALTVAALLAVGIVLGHA